MLSNVSHSWPCFTFSNSLALKLCLFLRQLAVMLILIVLVFSFYYKSPTLRDMYVDNLMSIWSFEGEVNSARKYCVTWHLQMEYVITFQTCQLSRFHRETHGLGYQLTVSWFGLQISRWIWKSWNCQTIPVVWSNVEKPCWKWPNLSHLMFEGKLGTIPTSFPWNHRSI